MNRNKMKNRVYVLIMGCGSWWLSGCNEEVDGWSGHDLVQFENYIQGSLTDSTTYSFGFDETSVQDTFVKIRIQLVGKVLKDQDRKIALGVITPDPQIRFGQEFVFDPDTCYVRKNQTFLDLYIRIKRLPALQHKDAVFGLQLKENEFFEITNRQWITDPVTGKGVDLLYHRVIFSDRIVRPEAWKESDEYFGVFSVKKFLLMCEVSHMERRMFTDETYMSTGRKNYVKTVMNRYLEKYKQEYAGDSEALKKIQEEDGTFMQMGKAGE